MLQVDDIVTMTGWIQCQVDSGSDCGSDNLVYTYILGQHEGARKGGWCWRTQGVGASFRLELKN
jgi:hypothetical protein